MGPGAEKKLYKGEVYNYNKIIKTQKSSRAKSQSRKEWCDPDLNSGLKISFAPWRLGEKKIV